MFRIANVTLALLAIKISQHNMTSLAISVNFAKVSNFTEQNNLTLLKSSFQIELNEFIVVNFQIYDTLLRPWIRRFTVISFAWWLRTSSEFSGQEFKALETP